MEDNGVVPLAAISEIEEDYEPFQNSEDIDSCKDFIPCVNESGDYIDSDDADDEDFYNDEVVENTCDVNDEHSPIEESSMHATLTAHTTRTEQCCKCSYK